MRAETVCSCFPACGLSSRTCWKLDAPRFETARCCKSSSPTCTKITACTCAGAMTDNRLVSPKARAISGLIAFVVAGILFVGSADTVLVGANWLVFVALVFAIFVVGAPGRMRLSPMNWLLEGGRGGATGCEGRAGAAGCIGRCDQERVGTSRMIEIRIEVFKKEVI